jgi:hypothetical protein
VDDLLMFPASAGMNHNVSAWKTNSLGGPREREDE